MSFAYAVVLVHNRNVTAEKVSKILINVYVHDEDGYPNESDKNSG
jgi:hypothetical protein